MVQFVANREVFDVANFISLLDDIYLCKQIAPDGTPRSAHLGLCCLPMSHKKDAKLK